MSPDKWDTVKRLFESALESDPNQVPSLLDPADPEIKAEVEWLLGNERMAGTFLQEPLVDSDALCGLALTEPRVFEDGDRVLGRFEILEFSGRGGMGEVYRGLDREMNEIVALKTVRLRWAAEPRVCGRFRQEVQRSRQVTHPNVCRIFDLVGDVPRLGLSLPVMSMEFLQGQTLQNAIRERGRLAAGECLPIAQQLCDGLGAAHKAGVLHCDFKSGNVILCPMEGSTRAVITDFGLAQTLDRGPVSQASLSAGAVAGTVAYLAPELVEGRAPGTASDIYALGVVLFEMIAGRYPFEADSDMVLAAMRLRHPPANPRDFASDLPKSWERAILACLATSPGERPQTPEQVSRLLRGDGGARARLGISRAAARMLTRRKLMGAGVGAVVAAGVAAWLLRYPRAPKDGKIGLLVEEFGASAGAESIARAARSLARVALAQSPRLRLVTDAEMAAKRIKDDGMRTAAATNASATLDARFQPDGSGAYRFAVRLTDVGSGTVSTIAAESVPSLGLSARIDRAALAVRRALGEEEESIRNHYRPLTQPDTLNPEALERFAAGMDCYYRGDIEGSLGLLESATGLDPDFANAYAYLALVNFALLREDEGLAAAERAFALRSRVNERARYEAERIYYIACGDYARSLERGRVLAALFPREASLHRSLAQAYSAQEKIEDALRHARLAVNLDPDNPSGRMLLAGILAQANQPKEALRIAVEGLPSHENPLPYLGQGFALLMDGKIAAAQDSFDKLNQVADLDPVGKRYRAAGLVLTGRLAELCEQLDAEIDVAVVRKHRSEETVRRYWLGQISALRADAGSASRQARALAGLPATPPCLEALRQGCEVAAACGDSGALHAAAGKLDRIRKAYPSTRSEGFFQQATGLLESCVKGPAAARGSLSRAYAVWPDISNAWSLAENLRVLGQCGDAVALYERIAGAKGTALRFDGVVPWVCSLAMAARCHRVLKNCGAALTRLNEFLSCWGATPGVPLVNATRSECASCVNEG